MNKRLISNAAAAAAAVESFKASVNFGSWFIASSSAAIHFQFIGVIFNFVSSWLKAAAVREIQNSEACCHKEGKTQ